MSSGVSRSSTVDRPVEQFLDRDRIAYAPSKSCEDRRLVSVSVMLMD